MCCGKKSSHLQTNTHNELATPSAPARVTRPGGTTFQYVGNTAATVIGPVSGMVYRFTGPGSRRQVDPRDRPGLGRLPILKNVS